MSKEPVLLVDNTQKRIFDECQKISSLEALQVETLRKDGAKQLLLEDATAVTELRLPNGDEVLMEHGHFVTLVDYTTPN